MSKAEDIALIVNTLNAYVVAVDTQQWDLFDAIFTEDCTCGFGGPVAFTDRATLKTAFAAIHAPFAATQHITTNHHVLVSGDSASAYSYVHGLFIGAEAMEGGQMFESTGWYEDDLVRTGAGWRIAARKSRMVWAGGNPAVLEAASGVKAEAVLDSPRRDAESGAMPHIARMRG